MTDTRIDEIKARCDNATPGAWEYGGIDFIFHANNPIASIRGWSYLPSMVGAEKAVVQMDNNAEFIAHARDDIPYLLSELERVTAERDALKEASRWIPVSERLPEIESTEVWGMYLCKLNRYGEIKIAALWFLGGSWYSDYSIGSRYDDFVIAWRQLPEVPESEE